MDDNKKKLYDALSQDYDLGSFEQFSSDIADEGKRRKLYDATSEEYDYGDFDSFSEQLGFGANAQQPAAQPAQPQSRKEKKQAAQATDPNWQPPKPDYQPVEDFSMQNNQSQYLDTANLRQPQQAEPMPQPSVQTEKTTAERNLDSINQRLAEENFPEVKDDKGNTYKMKAAAGVDEDGTIHLVATDKDGKDVELTGSNYADFMPDNSVEGRNRKQMVEDRETVDRIDKEIQALKDKDFHGSREQRKKLEAEKQRALYRLDNNPEYRRQIAEDRDKVAQRKSELDEALQQSGSGTLGADNPATAAVNPLAQLNDRDKLHNQQVYDAADRMLRDADEILATGLKYGKDNKGEFVKGAGRTMADPDFWTFGMEDTIANFTFRDVMERAVAQAEAEKKGETVDNPLSPIEEKLVEAYLTRAQAMMLRADDQSRGYKMGAGAAESLKFMVDMAITGAIGKAMTKGAAEAFSKKYMAKIGTTLANMEGKGAAALGKAVAGEGKWLGVKLAGDLIETVPKVAVSPLTAQAISQQAAQYDPETGFQSWGKSIGKGLLDAGIEKFSELHGGIYERAAKNMFKLSGAPALYKKIVSEDLRKTFSNIAKSTKTGKVADFFAKGGWDGMWEMAEEMEGAAAHELLMGEKGAWEDYWKRENWLEMAGSFAPMTIFGMGVNATQNIYTNRKLDKSIEKLGAFGFDTDALRERAENSSIADLAAYVSEGIGEEQKQRIAESGEGNGTVPADVRREMAKAAIDYVESAARKQALDGALEGEEAAKAEAKLDELKENMSGKRFWKSDNTVEIMQMPDGENVYVLSEPGSDGMVSVLHMDGTPGFAVIAEGQPRQIMTMDEYLSGRVEADRMQDEAARMETERQAQVSGIASQYQQGQEVQYQRGEKKTKGQVLDANDPDTLIVQTSDGTIDYIPWEEVAAWTGQSVGTLSDQEQGEAGAAALEAQDDAKAEMATAIEAGIEPGATVTGEDGQDYVVKGVVSSSINLETGTAKFFVEKAGGPGIVVYQMDLPYADFVQNGLRKGEEAARAEADRLAAEQEAAEEERKAAEKAEKERQEAENPDLDKLLDENPEEFARINDEQYQDGGADTREILTAKENELTAQIEELGRQRAASTKPSERRALADQANRLREKITRIRTVLDSYNTEDAVEEPAPAPAPAPQAQSGHEAELEAQRQRAQEQADADFPQIQEKWNAAPKMVGFRHTKNLPNGKRLRGHYVLTEADAMTPSHDPQNSYKPSIGFPKVKGSTVNDRDYEHDKSARQHTEYIAGRYNGTALDNIPTVTPDGVVIDGNGRTMASQIAARNGSDADYLETLREESQRFGFSEDQVAQFQHPRVVFVTDESVPYTVDTFAQFNDSGMKEQTMEGEAVKDGKILAKEENAEIVNTVTGLIGQFDTVDQALRDEDTVKQIYDLFKKAGVFKDSDFNRMFLNDKMTDTGKERIKNALLGIVFDEDVIRLLLSGDMDSVKKKLIRSMAALVKMRGFQDRDYDLTGSVSEAVRLINAAMQDRNPKSKDIIGDYMQRMEFVTDEEGNMSQQAPQYSERAQRLAHMILYNGEKKVKDAFSAYLSNVENAAAGEISMFGENLSAEDSIKNAIFEQTGEDYGITDNTQEQGAPAESGEGAAGTEPSRPSDRVSGSENGSGRGGAESAPAAGPELVEQETPESGYSVLDDEIAALEKEIADKIRGQLNAGLDPSLLPLVGRLAIAYIERGAYKIADFAAKMVAKFGDAIRTYIAPAYAYARQAFRIEGKRDVVDQMDNADTIDNFDHENFDKAPTAPAESKPTPTLDSIFAETTGQQEAEAVAGQIEEARQEVDTNPTDAQKEAGNYRKGHVTIDGYDISIENPKGSIRRGTDANGNEWQVEMNNDYGYIRMTEGPDGDHIDVFLSDTPTQGNVFVVDQVNPDTGAFDEHKVMYGFPDEQSAREAYLSNYSPGWKGLGNITEVSKEEFKKWIESSHRKTKPFAEYKSVTPVEEQPSENFGGLFAQPIDNQQNNSKNSRISEKESVTSQKEAQTAFRDTVRDALIGAVQTGEKPYAGITQLRKAASDAGMEVDERGGTDSLIQELVEDAIVRAAKIVNGEGVVEGKSARERYDSIVKLYEMQPSINQRSSSRIAKAQYSTPIPMGFLADMFGWKMGKTVLEPTAGNGMMVFAIPGKFVTANEIDATRLDNLRGMNFAEVTDQDATEAFPADRKYDVIIANPPFGSSGQEKSFDGKTFTKLEHIVALNALDAMAEDGRAAIIVGGNMEYNPNGSIKTDAKFWHFLYDHYNVKGVVDMDGSLFSRQGTTYPTRMILIDGKRSGWDRMKNTVFAPVKGNAPRKAETFDDLYDIVDEINKSNAKTNGYTNVLSEGEVQLPDNSNASGSADLFGSAGESRPAGDNVGAGAERGAGRRGSTRTEGSNESAGTQQENGSGIERPVRSGVAADVAEAQPGPDNGQDTSGEGDLFGADREGESGGNTGGPVSAEVLGTDAGVGSQRPQRVEEKRELESDKLHYVQHSGAFSLDSMAPAAMVEAMDNSLKRIEEEYGPIDEFVRKELGYKTKDDLYNALAAEQVDSVAMAIYQMKNGQAMIIGDQTGVGKGRQMAALIRWARKQGKKPIFVTQKSGLFSDLYRDLADTGSADLVPFIFNADGDMTYEDKDGNMQTAYKHASDSLLKQAYEKGELPEGCDYAILSYSQVSSGDAQSRAESKKKASAGGKKKAAPRPTPKADFLRKIAKDNFILMDESHTAAGESNTGAYFQSLIKDAAGATFASATFAKRPDTMPLYALRTSMSQANVSPEELIASIKKGGVALQEIMSRALTQTGQMVRRERDMSDVVTDWISIEDPDTVQRAKENYDRTIEAFNRIINFQENFVRPTIEGIAGALAMTGGNATKQRGTDKLGIDNTPFASKTYNYTKQLMLALKAEAVVAKVIDEIQAGRHPVIALESTMESGLKEEGYSAGDKITDVTFATSLLRGLTTVMKYSIKDSEGVLKASVLTPEELGPTGEAEYYNLQEFIRESTAGVFASPLDLITMRLQDAGYKVGELTGRDLVVQRSGDGEYIIAKRDSSNKAKKKAAADFNSGKLDVLILNKAASTGISLHASKSFKDQRQRTMILAQPMSDINDYMQMIGRIDRTGQVHRGYYINLALPVAAEQRFNMMLSTKLKSLNANTAADQEGGGSVEAVDLLNKYGDQVVVEYLRDHTDIYEKLGDGALKTASTGGKYVEPSELDDYQPKEDDARRITGRVALLSTQEQEEFYDDVIQRYNDLIQYLNDTGTNDLKITTLPLRVQTLSKKVSSKGVNPEGDNPFAKDAYVETVEMDNLRKPMKADEVKATIEKLNGGLDEGPRRLRKLRDLVTEDQSRKTDVENERYQKALAKLREDIAKFTDKVMARKGQSEEDKQKDIRSYVEDQTEKVEQKHNDNLTKIGGQAAGFRRKLEMFSVGATYLVPDQLDNQMFVNSSPAIFCGFKVNEKKLTPSTTFAVFAVLDGRRKVEVKLSQPGPLETIRNHSQDNWGRTRETSLENWDESYVNAARKKGFIMTGNILQAIADTQDEFGNFPGQLVSYTDIDGGIHDGILMPDNWKPSQLKNSGLPVNTKIQEVLNGGDVTSTDGKVTIESFPYGNKRIELYVPKSKKEGGKYFENQELIALTRWESGFNTFRGKMAASIYGEENIRKALDILSSLGVRVADESAEEQQAEQQQTQNRYRFRDDATGEDLRFRVREEEPPTRTGIGYKVFVLKDGKLYPPMVANPNGASTPTGLWLDADAAPVVGTTVTGRQQVKAGGKGTQGGSGTLSYRPGWHLGEIPYAIQFNRIDENGEKTLFPKNFVWAEVEYAADLDYQQEAMSYGMKESGKFQHSLAGLPYLPKDGFYTYRTNPNPETDPWIITGAMRVKRLLTPTEVDAMVVAAGRQPQRRQAGAVTDEQIEKLNVEIERQLTVDPEQMKNYIDDLSVNLGVKVRVIDDIEKITNEDERTQRRMRRSKGWYDTKTGEIVLVLPNAVSVADAEATVFHEGVGHEGLRGLFGDSFDKWLDEVYETADTGVRERIDAMKQGDTLEDQREATEEYMAEMAERGVEDNLEVSFWDRVKARFRELARALGIRFNFTDADIRYNLWKSKRRLAKRGESMMERADRVATDQQLRRNAEESYRILSENDEPGPEGDNTPPTGEGPTNRNPKPNGNTVRYRAATGMSRSDRVLRDRAITNDTQDVALRMYGNDVMLGRNVVRELLVDQFTAVRTAMRAIEQESGKEANAKEDITKALNQLSSKQQAASERYANNFLVPLMDSVAKVAEEMDVEFEDIIKYVSLRRALEANELYAKRDAKEYYQRKHDDAVLGVESRTDIDRAAKDQLIQQLDADLQNQINDTERGLSDKYRELRGTDGKHEGKDYGATVSWFSEYVDANGNRSDTVPAREPGEDNMSYQRRLKGMRKPVAGADTLAGAEDLASQYIHDFETRSGGQTRELWDKINAATGEILRIQYDSHLITKEQYDDIRNRSQYYVPLRGFADMTAEDAFSYVTDDLSDTFVPALMRAGGRISRPDSPFGFIAGMAASTINEAYKNMAVQTLYRFIANRKDNSLAVISDSWYTPTGRMVTMADVTAGEARMEDLGKEIWEPAYPNLDPDADVDAQRVDMDAFNADMEQKALLGQAVRGTAGLNLRNSFVFNRKGNEKQHFVRVKVLGDEKFIIFRGNPRAAQAINGILNPDTRQVSAYSTAVRAVARTMAKLCTSYSIPFWFSNFFRDGQTAIVNCFEKEGADYTRKMISNLPFAIGVVSAHIKGGDVHIKDAWSDAKKRRVQRLYDEYQKYAAGGAITGYSVIFNHAEYDKQFKRAIREKKSDLAETWSKIGDVLESIGRVSEGIEQVFRFATFITSREDGRPMEQCIDDAKNVTVNFNRKGSYAAMEWKDTANISTLDRKSGTYSTLGEKGGVAATAERAFIWFLSQIAPWVRTRFMFVNPNIQGTYTTYSNWKVSAVRTASAIFGVAMTSFLVHLASELFAPSPDDPDRKRKLRYSHLTDYQRRSNIILPELGGVRVSIPLSQEYAPFWAIGDIMATAALKEKYDQKTAWEIAKAIGEIMPVNVFEPTNIVPDPLAPALEAATNTNYQGRNIFQKLYNENTPDYKRAFNGTWAPLVDLSVTLNKALGGTNDLIPEGYGKLGNVPFRWNNPAAWQHIVEGMGGTTVSALGDVMELAGQLAGPEDVKLGSIPIVNRFLKDPYEWGNDWYLNTEAKKFKTLAADMTKRAKTLEKSGDMANLQRLYESDNWAITDLYNTQYKKEISRLENEIRNYKNSPDAGDKQYLSELQQELETLQEALIKDVKNLLKERK